MTFETCPLFDELDWVRYGFFGRDVAQTNSFEPIFFLPQKHTDVIIKPDDALPESGADAVLTDKVHQAIAIRTADCVPILLACTHTRQIAAVHAGWRGALNRIVPKTIERLCAAGAKPETLRAALGPSIHAVDYPVQDDVRDPFMADQPETASFFKPFQDRYCLDVAGIVTQQLRQSGVNTLWQSRINTFTDPAYASYRRNKPSGRNISVIMRTK